MLVFTLLDGVDTGLARVLVEKLVGKAEDWTTAQLRARLLLAADPGTGRR